jgi:hypothetical protein
MNWYDFCQLPQKSSTWLKAIELKPVIYWKYNRGNNIRSRFIFPVHWVLFHRFLTTYVQLRIPYLVSLPPLAEFLSSHRYHAVEIWYLPIVLPTTFLWWYQSFQPMTDPSLLRQLLLGWRKAFNFLEAFLDTWRTCFDVCLSFASIQLAISLT